MSLLNTKPRWAPNAIPSNRGWIDSVTGEVLVAIGNLEYKLSLENHVITQEPIIEVKEVIMNEQIQEQKVKRVYNKKPKVIGEVTEQQIPAGRQLIGEVVEYNLDTKVIAE